MGPSCRSVSAVLDGMGEGKVLKTLKTLGLLN